MNGKKRKLKQIKMCVNPECGNCGWEVDTAEERCGACRKRLVVAKTYYEE